LPYEPETTHCAPQPRAALEPEQVPQPPKHSRRARSTLVVVGNAIFTFLIVAMLLVGGVFFYGKKTIEAKGPLAEDKVVNIPPRAGMTDIGDILLRSGVISADRWTFIGSVLALNARSGLKSGEYLFQKTPACAMSSTPSSKARWCSIRSPFPKA
jgi:UPF0755 protein